MLEKTGRRAKPVRLLRAFDPRLCPAVNRVSLSWRFFGIAGAYGNLASQFAADRPRICASRPSPGNRSAAASSARPRDGVVGRRRDAVRRGTVDAGRSPKPTPSHRRVPKYSLPWYFFRHLPARAPLPACQVRVRFQGMFASRPVWVAEIPQSDTFRQSTRRIVSPEPRSSTDYSQKARCNYPFRVESVIGIHIQGSRMRGNPGL
jgi:hypothetical protein